MSSVDQDSPAVTNWDVRNFVNNARENIKSSLEQTKGNSRGLAKEIQAECYQTFEIYEIAAYLRANWLNFFHIPFVPAFHRPGWFSRYIIGPHNGALFESFFGDFWAGVTVALTLIPQVNKNWKQVDDY